METKIGTRTFYRVVPLSPSFSEQDASTLEEAKEILRKSGECPNGTPENKAYWKKHREGSKIVKVTEIIEDVS